MLLLLISLIIVIVTKRRAIIKSNRKIEKRYKQEISFYDSELTRINYIYNQLLEDKTIKQISQNNDFSNIQEDNKLVEQKKIELEKEDLSQRNKKLWDMSISIQKDKQRISILKKEIENKHKELTDSIQYAKRIQDAALPSTDILKETFSDYFIMWRPREIVSGDFYWMKRQDDLVIFTVADCTGHGVPGAFMSMLGIALLNEVCANINIFTKPSDILENLRTFIITTLKQQMGTMDPKDGMDMALCILNTKTLDIKFAGANNPMYLVSDGELTEFKAVRNPIGLYPKLKEFETIEAKAKKGDYIYMFSDGFPDQFSGNSHKKITYGRFKNLLIELNQKKLNSTQQQQELLNYFDNWRGDFIQMDDILIGGYQI
ncbi:MAG: SpoIIE family protein phosphatase [Bacteroidales bacterium]|nr:SpoIIE family protein phosphatase [Bacteroidales bacterium]